jgi:hypothetical protein
MWQTGTVASVAGRSTPFIIDYFTIFTVSTTITNTRISFTNNYFDIRGSVNVITRQTVSYRRTIKFDEILNTIYSYLAE